MVLRKCRRRNASLKSLNFWRSPIISAGNRLLIVPEGKSTGYRDDSGTPTERSGERKEDVGGNVDTEVDDRLSEGFLRYNEDVPTGTTL
jgi:hypothetical protein